MKQWFEEWFNTPFYHALYKNRNDEEAHRFIDALHEKLGFEATDKILDVACGKGRHAIYLNSKGLDVVGIDLSEANINAASVYANEKLHFFQHDMREVFRANSFDYVLNLFTSFGYFAHDADNQAAMQAMSANLVPDGWLLIDFMNSAKAIRELQNYEKSSDGIHFKIEKELANDFIIKHIRFNYEGTDFHFTEQVKALMLSDFERYFRAANLTIEQLWGNYQLEPFDASTSNRLILLARKTH